MKAAVVASLHNESQDRCVDILLHADGRYGFKEFRRDVEDGGAWFPAGAQDLGAYPTQQAAEQAARLQVSWLKPDAFDRPPD